MFMKCKVTVNTSHYPKDVPWELPEGWCWCKLEELCAFLSRGKSPVYSETSKEYPVFAQKCNLKEGGISLEKALFLNPDSLPKWPTEYRLKTGDVLVNSTGTGTVGRTRLFNEQVLGPYPFVVPDSHVSVIRTFSQISSEYVFILLSSEYGQQYFAENLAGSTNQKELYIASIAELQVPLPPAMEQKRIAEQVFSFEDNIKNLDDEKIRIQSFVESAKAKILDLAIHGKIVPQDPSDEPAIELLKRINPGFRPSDNLHYDAKLPDGWCVARLEEVAEYGDTSNVDVTTITSSSWVLELEDIEKDTASILEKKKKSDREINGVRHSFRKGQILYSKLRTYLNKVLIATEDGFCSTEIVPITASKALLSEYLLIVLRSPYFLEYTASCGYGVKMPRLGTNDAKKAIIPIPPHAEQVRIVKKVSDLMTVISSL